MRSNKIKFMLLAALLLGACATAAQKEQEENGPLVEPELPLRADLPALSAEMDNFCDRPGNLAAMTRSGCEAASAKLAQDFAQRGLYFKDEQACESYFNRLRAHKDELMLEHTEWCSQSFVNLHDLKGCKDGAEFLYSRLSTEGFCRQYASTAPKAGAAPVAGTPAPGGSGGMTQRATGVETPPAPAPVTPQAQRPVTPQAQSRVAPPTASAYTPPVLKYDTPKPGPGPKAAPAKPVSGKAPASVTPAPKASIPRVAGPEPAATLAAPQPNTGAAKAAARAPGTPAPTSAPAVSATPVSPAPKGTVTDLPPPVAGESAQPPAFGQSQGTPAPAVSPTAPSTGAQATMPGNEPQAPAAPSRAGESAKAEQPAVIPPPPPKPMSAAQGIDVSSLGLSPVGGVPAGVLATGGGTKAATATNASTEIRPEPSAPLTPGSAFDVNEPVIGRAEQAAHLPPVPAIGQVVPPLMPGVPPDTAVTAHTLPAPQAQAAPESAPTPPKAGAVDAFGGIIPNILPPPPPPVPEDALPVGGMPAAQAGG